MLTKWQYRFLVLKAIAVGFGAAGIFTVALMLIYSRCGR